MSAAERLSAVAQRQTALRECIARDRRECVAHGSQLAQPLRFIERGVLLWHRYAPLAKLGVRLWPLLTLFRQSRAR